MESCKTVVQKISIELPSNPAMLLMGIYPKHWKQGLTEIFLHLCPTTTTIFLAALFMISKMWKRSKCPTTDSIYTQTHTTEHYSALKRKEILTQVIIQMNLEGIRPKKINQLQSDEYYMIPLIWGIRSQINRDKIKWWLTALRERRNRELLFNRHRISVLEDEKVVWMDGSDGITAVWMHIILLNCIFLNGEDGKFYIMCTLPHLKISSK